MKIRLRYILLFLMLLIVGTNEAREAVMRFYTINDGLQNNQARQVISLPKDRRIVVTIEGGFEWFDGQRFHNMNVDRQQTIRIENFFSQTHHLDHNDRLWVRDYHRVYLFDAHSLRQLPVEQTLANSGLPLERIQNLFFDSDDDLWVSDKDGALWHYDWMSDAKCVAQPKQKSSQKEKRITNNTAELCDVVQVGKEVFILKLDGSISCYDKTKRQRTWTKQIGGNQAGRRFKAIAWDAEHFLLRSDGGLFKFNVKTKEIEKVLDDNNIYDFCRDQKGGLWVSGRYLLWHLNSALQHTEPYHIAINKHNKRRIESDWMGITIDWQGNLWACKQNDGVGYMSKKHTIIDRHCIIDSTYSVRSLIQQKDGVVAATTRGVFKRKSGQTAWNLVTDTQDNAFNLVCNDTQGQLWASGSDGLIMRIEDPYTDGASTETFSFQNTLDSRTEQPTPNWESIPFCLPIPKTNKLLTCTNNNNISILDSNDAKIEQLRQQFPELYQLRHIVAALQYEDGFLIGSQNGFVWYNSNDNSIDIKATEKLNNNPYSDKCNCMLLDSSGQVWIGTQNGLLLVERHNNQWETVKCINKENGLPSNCIISLIEDANNNLWVATYTGICRLSTKDNKTYASVILRDEDGINCTDLQERSACLCTDGTILFGSRNGYYTFYPQQVFKKQNTQKPILLEYAVCDTLTNIDLSNLNYLQNKLSFIISTLTYDAPQHVQYRYRLQGSNHNQWTIVDGKDGCIHIEYSLLPHGTYTLEVQACIMDQEWSEPLLIDFCITPPWWRTWWAWTLYVIFIILSTLFVTMAYLRAKRQRLEQRQLIAQLMAQLSEKESSKPDIKEEPTSRLSPKDRAFIDDLNKLINENISNEDLDTLFLANKLLISRTSLYRKMKSLLGIGANEYIRKVRLHKAKEMLENDDKQMLNISGIALECGFTSMSHFRSCFKDEFGILPGEIGKD